VTIPEYASGGTPASGELFIAREAGPELVGRIGGSTAVANNDMIVAGIAEGVYQAVTAAIGDSRSYDDDNGEGTINVTVQIDDEPIGRAAARYNKRAMYAGADNLFR
jgi:hypothetical protein